MVYLGGLGVPPKKYFQKTLLMIISANSQTIISYAIDFGALPNLSGAPIEMMPRTKILYDSGGSVNIQEQG